MLPPTLHFEPRIRRDESGHATGLQANPILQSERRDRCCPGSQAVALKARRLGIRSELENDSRNHTSWYFKLKLFVALIPTATIETKYLFVERKGSQSHGGVERDLIAKRVRGELLKPSQISPM